MKKIITGTWLSIALALPTVANAAFFDFQLWIANNGEKGFDNSSPFTSTDDGLTLTAQAFENPGRMDSHVYMDGTFNGIIGGMGVCTTLTTNNQCTPSSDDNVSIDGSNEEVLFWDFSQTITKLTLNMGNSEHPDFANSNFQYSLDSGTNWSTVATDGNGLVTLTFLGGTNQIEFRAAGNNLTDNFYIRSADILIPTSAIPVPAAAWLFGSGLLGLVGMARRKKA